VRYPYERFLRYLVSRKAKVDSALERIGLPIVGEVWASRTLAALYASAPPQIVRYLNAPRGRPFVKEGFLAWAEKHEIDTLWRDRPEFRVGDPSPSVALAGRLFFSPATRAVVGMLLLCDVQRAEICQIIKERFGLEIPEAALSVYQSLYWDCRQTTRAFWQDVVRTFSAEERQFYAHGLRWPPPRVDELRQLLGLDADDDPEAAFKEMLAIAKRGLRDAANAPIPEHQDVFKWMAVVERAAAQLRKGAKAAAPKEDEGHSLTAGLSCISISVDKVPIATLAELEGERPELSGTGAPK